MRFEKWQGLGNDFIVTEVEVAPRQAERLCDRHLGIGADGVLIVEREGLRMVVINADGSRPEMCGNGLRCVAGWLVEAGLATDEVSVETDAGARACAITQHTAGSYDVRAFMGEARITGELMHDGRRFVLVNVGNPHAVCFDALEPGEAERLGPAVEAAVAGGVNVELVSPRADGGFDVRVFERGVGWTDACGTGACAVAVAAVEAEMAAHYAVLQVHLPGGPLAVEVTDEGVYMRGPAERVFVGDVALPVAED